MIKRLVHTTLM